ncbi:hypothetical protein [Clostridium facile]|uniref:MFS transporter n=1 Tax=Clostridium facile TaxID=2763035 RepID=A0ABR7IP76_9CLOT|nr:hypothetical protein [Clostridium facile]MBC5786926.1 hypothetical protein [Clostridium facile]
MNLYPIIAIGVGACLLLICWLIAKWMDKVQKKDKPRDFFQRHFRLSIFMILVSIIMAGAAISYIIYYISQVLGLLVYNISKLDAVIIVALITGALSLITAIVAKIIGYQKSRQDYLAKKREQPYEELIEIMDKIQQNMEAGYSAMEGLTEEELSTISKQVTLWGSPKTVSTWVELREELREDTEVDHRFLMEELVNRMRKDLGLAKIKRRNFLSSLLRDIRHSKPATDETSIKMIKK